MLRLCSINKSSLTSESAEWEKKKPLQLGINCKKDFGDPISQFILQNSLWVASYKTPPQITEFKCFWEFYRIILRPICKGINDRHVVISLFSSEKANKHAIGNEESKSLINYKPWIYRFGFFSQNRNGFLTFWKTRALVWFWSNSMIA